MGLGGKMRRAASGSEKWLFECFVLINKAVAVIDLETGKNCNMTDFILHVDKRSCTL